MSVNRFLDGLNIFDTPDDKYVHAKATLALLASLGLLFIPASALRWDGTIRSRFDNRQLSPQAKEQLAPNAALNRGLRIFFVLASLGLTGYAGAIDFKDMQKTPLRKKKREAQSILEDELLNAEIVRMLPAEVEEEETPKPKLLPPALRKLLKDTDTSNDDPVELAKKFSTSSSTAQASSAPTRNAGVQNAIAAVENPEAPQDDGEKIDSWDKFRKLGDRICNNMIISDKSILIASGTGTGKTTTERYLLDGLNKHFPNIEYYALLQKNDELPGIPKENTQIFDPDLLREFLNPPKEEKDEDGNITSDPPLPLEAVFRPLFQTYAIFVERKQLPTAEREKLRKGKPIRCILGDWFATFQEIKRLPKHPQNEVMSMIRSIITVGRDMGVGFVIDTQSGALVSLGLAEDASIRESLDIYSQGFVQTVTNEITGEPQEKGEVRTMLRMIDSNAMVDPADREQIKKAYYLLTNGINGGQLSSPIIFTTVGSTPSIGLVPDLSRFIVKHDEEIDTQVDVTEVVEVDEEDLEVTEEIVIAELPTEINLNVNKTYTILNLDADAAIGEILDLKSQVKSYKEIFKTLWNASPGDNKAYKNAREEYRLLKEYAKRDGIEI